jgi:hypothetical protein
MYEVTVKDLVKDNKIAEFSKYFDGSLWYRIYLVVDKGTHSQSEIYEFPVPVADIGTATFNATEKSLLLMRYIRKAMEDLTLKQIVK